jgi:hypothetical protein
MDVNRDPDQTNVTVVDTPAATTRQAVNPLLWLLPLLLALTVLGFLMFNSFDRAENNTITSPDNAPAAPAAPDYQAPADEGSMPENEVAPGGAGGIDTNTDDTVPGSTGISPSEGSDMDAGDYDGNTSP